MPGLLGKKIGMTSVYSEDGNNVPVTVIQAGPCKVLSVRDKKKNGYFALQLGYGKKKTKRTTKPEAGIYKKLKTEAAQVVKEFKNFGEDEFKTGDDVTVEIFNVGDKVKVSGKSIGKGFQGVMRRHGFGGVGGTTHGQSDRLRAPGSIGQSSYPSRVFKGTRMAGRTGYDNVTVKNLKVIKIDAEKNIIMVKGAIPGSENSFVEINK